MMEFNHKSEDGEIELLQLDKLNDLEILSLGTPHKGSACSFRINNLNKFSTEHKPNPQIPVAPSTYLSWTAESESGKISAVIGVTSTSDFDRLLDICLTRLHVGETGQFVIKSFRSEYSYDFKLELLEIQESIEIHGLTPERTEELCSSLKAAGVCLFTQGYVVDAFYKFSEAIKLSCLPHPRIRKSAQVNFISTLQSNMAGCHVKLQNWEEAIDLCDSVIQRDPNNVKALYRRGFSLIEIQEYEKAEEDLLRAKQLDPDNQAVKNKLAVLEERKKALNAKYAQAMKKFFT